MKITKTSKYIYNKMNEFPRVKKEPQKYEVWLALFPYETLGNMEKIRPVYITKVKEDTVMCRMITTNSKNGKKIKGKLSTSKYFTKDSYVKDDVIELPIYKLYGRMKHRIEFEEE